MAVRHYRAFLHRGDDGAFGVVFPEFPGCVTCGDTASAALEVAAEAIALHVEDMEGIAEPADISAPVPDWCDPPDMVALVPLEVPGRSVRVQVTMDEGLLARIDMAAKAGGMSRSAFLAESARAKLPA